MGCSCFDVKVNETQKNPVGNKKKKENKKENKIDKQEININEKIKNDIDKKYGVFDFNEKTKNFCNNALEAINKYRKTHNVSDLVLDEYLCERAYIISKQYLETGDYDNDNLLYKNSEDLGINQLLSKIIKPEELINIWYEENEKKKYNYHEPELNELECHNFTQMVWKNSKKFGIGYYLPKVNTQKNNSEPDNNNNEAIEEGKKNIEIYYIALFYPAGNKPGEYIDNVLKRNFKNNINNGGEDQEKNNENKNNENNNNENKNNENKKKLNENTVKSKKEDDLINEDENQSENKLGGKEMNDSELKKFKEKFGKKTDNFNDISYDRRGDNDLL